MDNTNTFLQGRSLNLAFQQASDLYAQNGLTYEYRIQYAYLTTDNYNKYLDLTKLSTSWAKLNTTGNKDLVASIELPHYNYDYAFQIQVRAYDADENLYSDVLTTDKGYAIYNSEFSATMAPIIISANKDGVAQITIRDMGLIRPSSVDDATKDNYWSAVMLQLGGEDLQMQVQILSENTNDSVSTDIAVGNWLTTQGTYEMKLDLTGLNSGRYRASFTLVGQDSNYTIWSAPKYTDYVRGAFRFPPLQMYRSGIYVNMPEPTDKAELSGAAGAVINSNPTNSSGPRYTVELRDEPQNSDDRDEQTPQINFKAKTDNGVLRYEEVNQTNSFTFDKPIVLKDNLGNKFIFNFENGVLSLLLESKDGNLTEVPFLMGGVN